MSSRRSERIAARYRDRLVRLRAAVDAKILAVYGDTIDLDALDASFARFIDQIEPTLAAGQSAIAVTAAAFVRSVASEADAVDVIPVDPRIVGTTREGKRLRDGMAAWGPMVLAQIAAGHTPDEALEYGRYLASRFADNELTGAADREVEHQASSPRVTGWEGIVAPGACDPCAENAGPHDLDEQLYRHPSCNCTQVLIFG